MAVVGRGGDDLGASDVGAGLFEASPTQNSGAASPMPSGTRCRLKAAARRLIAERGIDAVGTRDIIKSAGSKNLTSINYYFGSKDGLIYELGCDVLAESDRRWKHNLDCLKRRGGPQSVREIVEAIIVGAEIATADNREVNRHRVLFNVIFSRLNLWQDFRTNHEFNSYHELLKLTAPMLPHIPAHIMRQRIIFFCWYVLTTMNATEMVVTSPQIQKNNIWASGDWLDNLIDTCVALLEAPMGARTVAAL
jgi:AcrR family transcriptional regulator